MKAVRPGEESMTSTEAMARRYDARLVDLDGVVYRGEEVVPTAPATLDHVRGLGIKLLFITNNSARTPEEVTARLVRLGVHAKPSEILTSALATAAMLRGEGAAGKRAFVVGEKGIREALRAVNVEIVDGEPDEVDLVVVGWDRSADYAKLRTACLLVERGARLIATNPDASFPAPDGLWPGAGAILSVITTTTGATPSIVGKPERPLFQAAAESTGATRPLVVGDRLDTDVGGAHNMGWDSLLVLTGASTPAGLLEAAHLPTYVAGDISGVLDQLPAARVHPAKPEDAPAIRALLEEAGLSAEGVEARIADTIVSGEGDEREIEATACLQSAEDYGILRSVAVRKSLQGKGLGMLAVAAAVTRARPKTTPAVYLFTENAEAFFARLGFRKVDRSELPDPVRLSAHADECPDTATAMVREL
jgi:glycerol 3-phosphatase-2